MQRNLGIWLVVISALGYGTLATFGKMANAGQVPPTMQMLLRFTIACLFLLPLLVWRRVKMPRGKLLLGLVLMGAVLYLGQSYAYFTALTVAKAGLVSLLLYLYPGIVAILAWLFLKERLTPIKLGALVLAVIGAAFAIGPVDFDAPQGIAWGLASAVFYSLYILAGTRLMAKAEALSASFVIMASTGAVYLVLVLLERQPLPDNAHGWWGVVGLAVASVIAITALLAGLERVGPVNASTISAIEPLVTLILAAIILGEMLSPIQLLGGALILAATMILVRFGAPSENADPEKPLIEDLT